MGLNFIYFGCLLGIVSCVFILVGAVVYSFENKKTKDKIDSTKASSSYNEDWKKRSEDWRNMYHEAIKTIEDYKTLSSNQNNTIEKQQGTIQALSDRINELIKESEGYFESYANLQVGSPSGMYRVKRKGDDNWISARWHSDYPGWFTLERDSTKYKFTDFSEVDMTEIKTP